MRPVQEGEVYTLGREVGNGHRYRLVCLGSITRSQNVLTRKGTGPYSVTGSPV
jgi:hypothetical protein